MIQFKTLKYRNVLTSGNQFIEVDFQKNATTAIMGQNGAGKCLHPSTNIHLSFNNKEIEKLFIEFQK